MGNGDVLGDLMSTPAPPLSAFRERSAPVGSVYSLSYDSAVVAVFDRDREQQGGLARHMFLLAAPAEGESDRFPLLQIRGEGRLPEAPAHDLIRQQGIEESGNAVPWPDKLAVWQRDQISLHAIDCRVLGTFIKIENGYRFAEDVHNYYAVSPLMAWKPDEATLDLIVNHRHRANDIGIAQTTPIGYTRFSAAEPEDAVKAPFRLNPADIMRRRTVYFGMSRSGKSNGLKIVAEAVYRLRIDHGYRVGQLIFDLNGEYAQNNPQDGKSLHRIHEAVGYKRNCEVATYGLTRPSWDSERKLLKFNFFGKPLPVVWNDDEAASDALDQLLAGREIIIDHLADETAQYVKAFRDADLSLPRDTEDRGEWIRYRRSVLAYQSALVAAGFRAPVYAPSFKKVFGSDFLKEMEKEYPRSADLLQEGTADWSQLPGIHVDLEKFISGELYEKFDDKYQKKSGKPWADPRYKALLQIFKLGNGPRRLSGVTQQHDPEPAADFADEIYDDLALGKLVIIDQSSGEPDQHTRAAERIMWKVFRGQQERFKSFAAENDSAGQDERHIVVYVEEAHNHLPQGGKREEILRSVWARAAKEGSKMNLGMVLATQAPSSIMPEILSETDNWVIAYLNSRRERAVVEGYMDFGEFAEQIGRVSEPGFVRIRTLSQAYAVPVQLNKFGLEQNPGEA